MEESDKLGDSEKLPRGYLIVWALGGVLVVIPLLVSVYLHPGELEQQLLFFCPIFGFLLTFAADQRNLLRQQTQWRQQMLRQVRNLGQGNATLGEHLAELEETVGRQCARAILNAAVIIPYSVRDAHHHVATNAKRALQIHNTRLAPHVDEAGVVGYMQARNMQDQGFKDAVVAGTVYHLIYDVSQRENVDRFISEVRGIAHQGEVHVHAVDAQNLPLVQFIVLNYGNDNVECLLGYGVGDEIGSTEQIFLIRSVPLCTYLVRVFGVYRRLLTAKPVDHHGPDELVNPST